MSVLTRQMKHGLLIVDAQDAQLLNAFHWYSFINGNVTYVRSQAGGKEVRLQRLILAAPKGLEVGYKNNNGLDNRRGNLFLGSRQEILINRRLFASNKSGFRGVCWDINAGRWQSSIKHNNRQIRIGRFTTPEEAARAFDAEALRLRGADARLNFPAPS